MSSKKRFTEKECQHPEFGELRRLLNDYVFDESKYITLSNDPKDFYLNIAKLKGLIK